MAIIKGVPGVIVAIKSDNAQLHEYDDDSDSPPEANTITKYVEAQSGARFAITGWLDPVIYPYEDDCVEIEIRMDGQKITNLTRTLESSRKQQKWSYNRRTTVMDGRTFHQYLTFSELHITENEVDKALFGRVGDLGTITVRLFRAKYKGGAVQPPRAYQHGPFPTPAPTFAPQAPRHDTAARVARLRRGGLLQQDEISEKNLKGRAISHQAKFGEPVEQPSASLSDATSGRPAPKRLTVLLDREPFAIFHFMYRSREALRALYIIPRTPLPSLMPVDEPMHEGTAKASIPDLHAPEEEVKRELKRGFDEYEDEDDEDPEVVDERPSKQVRTTFDADTEFVNLWGDN